MGNVVSRTRKTGGGVVLLQPGIGGGLFQPGYFRMHTLPESVRPLGAGWRLVGHPLPNYYNDNETSYGLLAGGYTAEFADVPGWIKPANQAVTIKANQTAYATGSYVPIFGVQQLLAQIDTSSQFWRLRSGTWTRLDNSSTALIESVMDGEYVRLVNGVWGFDHGISANGTLMEYGGMDLDDNGDKYDNEVTVLRYVESAGKLVSHPVFKKLEGPGSGSVRCKRSGTSTWETWVASGALQFTYPNMPFLKSGDQLEVCGCQLTMRRCTKPSEPHKDFVISASGSPVFATYSEANNTLA